MHKRSIREDAESPRTQCPEAFCILYGKGGGAEPPRALPSPCREGGKLCLPDEVEMLRFSSGTGCAVYTQRHLIRRGVTAAPPSPRGEGLISAQRYRPCGVYPTTPHPSRRDRRATFPSRGRLESAQRYQPCGVYPTTPHPSRRTAAPPSPQGEGLNPPPLFVHFAAFVPSGTERLEIPGPLCYNI